MRMFAFVCYGFLKAFEDWKAARKSLRRHVRDMKKAGTAGVEFDCDGYVIRIYKPGTNMDGPWPS